MFGGLLTVLTTLFIAVFGYNLKSTGLNKRPVHKVSINIKTNQHAFNILISEIVALKQVIKSVGRRTEDIDLNIVQLIQKYGFPVQKHDVITQDGYNISLHRIPNKGPVVFLMHGILLSSDDWVTGGNESGLAYILAAKGFDVWMGNARGNKHSKRHVQLYPNSAEFWNFSWDEIGRYDLPASIDYILNVTGKEKLHYIGYSQGTTAFFIMCSELPEYNDKIVSMIGLAPVGSMANIISPIIRLLFNADAFQYLFSIGQYNFFPNTDFSRYICTDNEIYKIVCTNLVFLFFGFDRGQINVTNLPVIFSHAPSGCSYKQFEHYRQSYLSKKFRRYDYGKKKNSEVYGSEVPPDYAVEKITVPMDLFYSNSDWIATGRDAVIMGRKLRNANLHYIESFNHLDFLFGNEVKEKIYVKIVELLQRL